MKINIFEFILDFMKYILKNLGVVYQVLMETYSIGWDGRILGKQVFFDFHLSFRPFYILSGGVFIFIILLRIIKLLVLMS